MLKNWKLLVSIFFTFFKIGPVTFGGGYAMILLIEREVVTRKKWVSIREITDIFAVSESCPGAIALNSSTFIGYRIAGPAGAVAAILGVAIPPAVIATILSILFLTFKDNHYVEAAFGGIRPAIVALIVYAGYKIGKMAVIDKTTFGITALTVGILMVSHFHPVLIILCGGLVGIILVQLKQAMGMHVQLDPTEGVED